MAGATAKQAQAPRLFYGWIVVGVAFLGAMMAGSLVSSFGFFVRPMEAELGWSRTTTLAAVTLGTLAGAVTGPLIGPLVDRYGARALTALGGTAAGLALALIFVAHHVWVFYLCYGLASAVLMGAVSQALTGMVVPKWFVRKRGRALANATLGFSVAGIALGPLTQALIGAVGWRATWAIIGTAVFVLVAIPGGWLLRRQPEDMGLRPDGDPPVAAGSAPGAAEPVWTVRSAARSRALWLLLAAYGLASFVMSPFFINLVPFLQREGFSPGLVSGAWATFFVFSFLSKWGWGFLVERVHIRRCVMAAFVGEMLSITLLLLAHSPAALFLFAVVGGIGHGPFPQFSTQIWADYFGRPFLGTIRGLFSPPGVIAAAAGPLVAGRVFDATGTYRPLFLSYIGVMAVALFLVFLARPPERASAQVTASQPDAGRAN